jgi:LacI family transcriptional regulator
MSLSERPTVIICISNPQVQGTMAGLKNMGVRVPQDVSVLSFDGFNPAQGWYPVITSLIQDTERVSTLAVERLLARIGDLATAQPEVIRVRPTLRIGDSCSAPNSG